MKKLITLAGAAALALLSTSCLQQHTTLSLNKDGSGSITETTLFGEQMLAMMGAAGEGQDPLAQMIQQANAKSAAAAAKMGEGVTLKEVKALNEGGKKGIVTVYEFKDINKLKYAFGQSLNNGPDNGDKKEPLDISYKDGVLTINNKHEKPEKGADAGNDEIDENGLAMAQQMMADVRISLSLEFPGGIAETNASHVEGNKVTMMDVDMGKLIAQGDKFKEFMKAQPESPAAAKELLKDVDGVKIETAEKLTIKLK
jgi:hypothetical protein